jgi:hypothetical protein
LDDLNTFVKSQQYRLGVARGAPGRALAVISHKDFWRASRFPLLKPLLNSSNCTAELVDFVNILSSLRLKDMAYECEDFETAVNCHLNLGSIYFMRDNDLALASAQFEKALMLSLVEMYVHGVSTRKVKAITEARKTGIYSVMDMLNVPDPVKVVKSLAVKPDIVELHRAIDAEREEHAWGDIAALKNQVAQLTDDLDSLNDSFFAYKSTTESKLTQLTNELAALTAVHPSTRAAPLFATNAR